LSKGFEYVILDHHEDLLQHCTPYHLLVDLLGEYTLLSGIDLKC
jgi:hypothetical protein